MSSRRELLRTGSLAGLAAFVPWSAFAGGTAPAPGVVRLPAPKDNGAFLTRSLFRQQLGSTFAVARSGAASVSLQLVEVADPLTAAAAGLRGSQDCFSAIFRGPLNGRLTQGTYTVTNTYLGKFALFLVPVGRPVKNVYYYEASFNRVVPG